MRRLQREAGNWILRIGCLEANPTRMLMVSSICDSRKGLSGKITLGLKWEFQMRQNMNRTGKRHLCFKPVSEKLSHWV